MQSINNGRAYPDHGCNHPRAQKHMHVFTPSHCRNSSTQMQAEATQPFFINIQYRVAS